MGEHIYYTYVLYSQKFDKLYIGHTSNLQKRLVEHNAGRSRFTKSYIPWELVYYKEFPTRSLAMKREKELKSHKGRDFIRKEILPVRVRQLPD
ncbi:MAG: GIY-YIG nuclease family protein [Ignavibacteriaceae bacterium]|jgi:putative endonuclease|nr:GIY-YIG nuclease family protein [Ignavibacteriaceae bacterium]MCW8813098.1 GIY-YIG nuclease family protein [Chlorobium sp.]